MRTAERHDHAVGLVAAGEPGVVLEIGCGNGAALALLAERLPEARLIGVDRSATAVARAAQRLAEPVRSGRVTLLRAAAGELDLPDGSVDVAFAVDVNLFWTGTGAPELATLRRVLRRGGVLHLVVAPPAPNPRVRAGMEAALRGVGWTTTAVVERAALVAVSATPG